MGATSQHSLGAERTMMECPRCGSRFRREERYCSHDGERLARVPDLPGLIGPEALVGRLVDDRYRIEAAIGRGGMGTVYRAEHVKLGKAVALKVLHPHLTLRPVVLARFEREARAASQIGHDNIVEVYDMGEVADIGSPYIAMELLSGESLKDVFQRQKTLEMDQIVHFSRQICTALQAAHDAGIVHRDLKPANVFLVGRAPLAAHVKLLDFGVSKLTERQPGEPTTTLTGTGVILGTPGYMAPEQADGRDVDARADIYSYGVILYRALSGTVPFKAANMMLLLQRIVEEPPMPPSLRAPERDIPRPLEEVVMRALDKDADRRPQTAAALLEEIDAAVAQIGGSEEMTSRDVVPFGLRSRTVTVSATLTRPGEAVRPGEPPRAGEAPEAVGEKSARVREAAAPRPDAEDLPPPSYVTRSTPPAEHGPVRDDPPPPPATLRSGFKAPIPAADPEEEEKTTRAAPQHWQRPPDDESR